MYREAVSPVTGLAELVIHLQPQPAIGGPQLIFSNRMATSAEMPAFSFTSTPSRYFA
jgi:hypothetical protein